MDLKIIRNRMIGDESERAVSPVIGVILMVAITVILAAVIAAFVLDIGDLNDSAPNAQYDWESEGDDHLVTWSHQSGDDIDLDTLSIAVTIEDNAGATYTKSEDIEGDDFTASDSIEFEVYASGTEDDSVSISDVSSTGNLDYSSEIDTSVESIEEITVTWEGDGSSTIIADWEA